jgi:NAD(P)-dependent dehydrogenase (short-subunit alcohol dehydrogenase family)
MGLDGRRAVLVGTAETSLLEATIEALDDVDCAADIIDVDSLAAATEVDVCVCFARQRTRQPLAATDADGLAADVREALLVPQRTVMTAAHAMTGSGGGAIVVVGSLDATHAYPGRAAASVAMGGLLGLVRAIAVELSGVGIRANLVLAGPMGDADGGAPGADDALLERTLQRSPLGRLGTPAEAAAAIRFLASPASDFMTGQTLRVDGGWSSLNQAPDGMRFR